MLTAAALLSALAIFSHSSRLATAAGVNESDENFFIQEMRLLQFSSSHKEYIPSVAVDYLLELRHAHDEEGHAVANSSPLDVEAVRASHPLLADVSDEAILALGQQTGWSVGYKDLTGLEEDFPVIAAIDPDLAVQALPTYPTPNKTLHPEYAALAAKVSAQELKYIVGNLSQNFATRYYRSSIARQSPLWIQSWLANQPNTTATLFENTFNQPNVIGRLSPVSPASSATILLAGHLDSTSSRASTLAPGADDDASGTAVAMHVFSILAQAGWIQSKSKYPLEVHAYAGEEGGLLGSARLASSYNSAGRQIRGLLNLEMVGWQPETAGSSTITVLTDPQTTMANHAKAVLTQYLPTATVRTTTCGYGCSDHYSWSDLGFPVVCLASYGPNDANLNPNYHSTSDTIDKLNFDRMADFARATIAWVLEVGSTL